VAPTLLGPAAYGIFNVAQRVSTLFELLPDCGMAYASTLAISRDRSQARGLMPNVLGLQLLLSLDTVLACVVVALLFYGHKPVLRDAILVMAGALVFKAFKNTLRWLLRGFEMFGTEAASLVVERLLTLVVAIGAVRVGYGVLGFVLAIALVRLADMAALFGYVSWRVVPLRPALDSKIAWDLLRKGLPFAYAGAMITIFFKVGTVILGYIHGETEVGYYSLPIQVLEGLTLVPRILSYALIPTMAVLHTRDAEAVAKLYRRGTKYLLVAGLPVVAFGLVAARPFILIWGQDYAPSVGLASIVLPAALFMFLSNFGETTLACVNRWRSIMIVSTMAVILNVGINLALIPGFGAQGAAWATLLTEAFYCVATAVALRRAVATAWLTLIWRPLLAVSVFAALLWVALPMANAWHSLVAPNSAPALFILARLVTLAVAVAPAALGYAGATMVLRVWDPAERRLVVDLLRRRR
jgi:O-antigen/teichoic acid export membrane protein